MPLGFGNLLGLAALASLIPFIILYFIRPKPKEVVIPSIMFLGMGKEFRSRSGFLRRLISDKLLLLQIIVLTLISLFFSTPYLSSETVTTGEVVFVLDSSASIGSQDNFERVKDEAINNIASKNTLITVANNPYLLFENLDADEAEKEINKLQLTGTRSAITESLAAAKNIALKIPGEKTIVVVSDFIDSEGGDVAKQIESIKSAGMQVKIVNVGGGEKENVGITSMLLRKTKSEVLIKNFCCKDKDITLDYNGEKTRILVKEGEAETYAFDTKDGKSVLAISGNDAVEADNSIQIVNEKGDKASVLLISKEENKFLEAAVKATDDLSFDRTTPDKPREGYDVYIIDNIGQDSLKLEQFLEDELKKGKSVVIIPEEEISGDYRGLLDFEILKNVPGGIPAVDSEAPFTDVDFGKQSSVRELRCVSQCTGVYVSAGDEPLIMIHPKYKGLIGYYGMIDEAGFQNRPDYPIFWTRFIKHLGKVKDLSSVNLRTGSALSFGEEVSFTSPSGFKGKDKTIVLEEVGFYEIDGTTYSANLLSEEESNLEPVDAVTSEGTGVNAFEQKYIINKGFWKWVIMAAMFLLLLEWIFVNRRERRQKYHV